LNHIVILIGVNAIHNYIFVLQYIAYTSIGEKMKTDMISTRIDHRMKIEFTHVCEEIGLNPSQAIKLFAKAVINHGGIPFELKVKQPNSITAQAIDELETGRGNKASSTKELFNDLSVDIVNA